MALTPAEISAIAAETNKANAAQAQYNQTLSNTNDITKTVNGSVGEWTTALEKSGSTVSNIIGTFKNFISNIKYDYKSDTSDISGFSKAIGALDKNTGGAAGTMAIMALQLGHVSQAGHLFRDFTNESAAGANKFSESFSNVNSRLEMLKNIFPSVEKVIGKSAMFIDGATSARNFENRILAIASASGNLETTYKAAGRGLERLDDITTTYMADAVNMGNATGLTSEQMMKIREVMKDLPGLMDDMHGSSGKSATGMKNMQGAIQIAKATGQDYLEVCKRLNDMHLKYGGNVDEVSNSLSLFYKMQQGNELNAGVAKEGVEGIADSFKMFGNNVDGATRLLDKFGNAFKGSNFSQTAMNELVVNIASGIKQMDIGTRAFISAQSGGRGGIKGAFDMLGMMTDENGGGIDKIFDMQVKALKKKMGGKILTYEEAGKTGQQEKYMLQQNLAQSGAFGKMATDEASGRRLFEAINKGLSGSEALKQLGSGKDAGAKAKDSLIAASDDILKRNNNDLIKYNNALNALDHTTSLYNDHMVRMLTGAGYSKESETKEMLSRRASGKAVGTKVTGEEGFGFATNKLGESGQSMVEAALKGAKYIGDTFHVISDTANKNAAANKEPNRQKRESMKDAIYTESHRQHAGLLSGESFPKNISGPISAREGLSGSNRVAAMHNTSSGDKKTSNEPVAHFIVECPSCHEKHTEDMKKHVKEIASNAAYDAVSNHAESARGSVITGIYDGNKG